MKLLGKVLMVLVVCALLVSPSAFAFSGHSCNAGTLLADTDTIPYPGPDDTDDDGGCGGGGSDGGNDDGPDSTDGGDFGGGGNDDGPDSTGGVLF